MARNWRVSGTFLTVGEVAVIVTAPNLIGAIRKGALAIKHLPAVKGRRLKSGLFQVQESAVAPVQVASEQAALPAPVGPAPAEVAPVEQGSAAAPGEQEQAGSAAETPESTS